MVATFEMPQYLTEIEDTLIGGPASDDASQTPLPIRVTDNHASDDNPTQLTPSDLQIIGPSILARGNHSFRINGRL
jgi:hypothetical protein